MVKLNIKKPYLNQSLIIIYRYLVQQWPPRLGTRCRTIVPIVPCQRVETIITAQIILRQQQQHQQRLSPAAAHAAPSEPRQQQQHHSDPLPASASAYASAFASASLSAPSAVQGAPAQAQQHLQSHQPRGNLKRFGHQAGHQFARQSPPGQLLWVPAHRSRPGVVAPQRSHRSIHALAELAASTRLHIHIRIQIHSRWSVQFGSCKGGCLHSLRATCHVPRVQRFRTRFPPTPAAPDSPASKPGGPAANRKQNGSTRDKALQYQWLHHQILRQRQRWVDHLPREFRNNKYLGGD